MLKDVLISRFFKMYPDRLVNIGVILWELNDFLVHFAIGIFKYIISKVILSYFISMWSQVIVLIGRNGNGVQDSKGCNNDK